VLTAAGAVCETLRQGTDRAGRARPADGAVVTRALGYSAVHLPQSWRCTMADIHIHRDHQLGLEKAREVAWAWAEQVEQKFDMECTVLEGDTSDTVEFERSGVKGQLIVTGDHFELEAKLGFLLGAFKSTIEAEVQKELDALLAKSSSAKKATKKKPG